MRRDMDLVRAILLEMGKWPFDHRDEQLDILGHPPEEVMYHIGLMHQAKLIEAIDVSCDEVEGWLPVKILWDGHEFIDAARSDTIWSKAKTGHEVQRGR